jgi:hypothetical protein
VSATLYEKQQAETAKVARQHTAKAPREAKDAQAVELATERALKKQQRDALTAEKSSNILNKSRRKASYIAAKILTKRCRVVAPVDRTDAGPLAASPPPSTSVRDRQFKTSSKFKLMESFAYTCISIHKENSR